MKILGIDTSCDDTCIAILEALNTKKPCFKILSNIVSSQVKIHQKWGGVYPSLAKREHQKNLPKVLKKAMSQAKNPKPDLIAVTSGPGLDPCLWQGINFSQSLAKDWGLKILAVNHIEAHILANWLTNKNRVKIQFPSLCLIVSGGHTQLILMKNIGSYKILGETRDDAAGECFDKVARILGLGYPGGPIIAKEAAKLKTKVYKFRIKLPRPMIHQKNYDFSFSGLKTAVLYDFKNTPPKTRTSKTYIQEMSAKTQQAIIDVLIHKTLKAAKAFKVRTIILGGGVVANQELRKQFKKRITTELPDTIYLKPDTKFCTDNAAMIATTAFFHKKQVRSWKNIKANANLRIRTCL